MLNCNSRRCPKRCLDAALNQPIILIKMEIHQYGRLRSSYGSSSASQDVFTSLLSVGTKNRREHAPFIIVSLLSTRMILIVYIRTSIEWKYVF